MGLPIVSVSPVVACHSRKARPQVAIGVRPLTAKHGFQTRSAGNSTSGVTYQ
jgi:hypothetical protein